MPTPALPNLQATYGENDVQLAEAANGATARTPFAQLDATDADPSAATFPKRNESLVALSKVPAGPNLLAKYGKNDCKLKAAANGATARTPFAHPTATFNWHGTEHTIHPWTYKCVE